MKKDYTEIIFLMDESGSMGQLRDDAIGSFNSMIDDQRDVPGTATVTLITFSTEVKEIISSKGIDEVKPIDHTHYSPGGMTALFDAMGRTIDSVGKRIAAMPEDERPDKVAFAIMTDGHENSSREYTREQIKKMVTTQTDEFKWEFFFMGANIDSFTVGRSMGIAGGQTMNFEATSKGVSNASVAYSGALRNYRTNEPHDLSKK